MPCNCEEECLNCPECVEPSYTNISCPNGTFQSDCIISSVPTETCVGLVQNTTTLSNVITKLITYIKGVRNRIYNADTSLLFTQIDDDCDDKVSVRVRLDPDVNNSLELRPAGIFSERVVTTPFTLNIEDTNSIDLSGNSTVLTPLKADVKISSTIGNIATINSTGIFVPDLSSGSNLCTKLEEVFVTDVAQKNNVDSTTYDFLIKDVASVGCDMKLISPPTGFAVSGTTRQSAFGKMEWFDTLTLANAAINSGETLLLYKDTTENLVAKCNVNYVGVGIAQINNITEDSTNCAVSTADIPITRISNLIVNGSMTLTRLKLELVNTTIYGNVYLNNKAMIHGGYYLNKQGAGVSLVYGINESVIEGIYSEKTVNLTDSSVISNFIINTTPYPTLFGLTLSGNTGVINASNGKINSINSAIVSDSTTSVLHLSNIEATSSTDAIILNLSNFDSSLINRIINVVGICNSISSGHGLVLTSSIPIGYNGDNIANIVVENCKGFSTTSNGINSTNVGLKNCYGYSVQSEGIYITGANTNVFKNTSVINTIGESVGSNGIHCFNNINIIGGTYVSRLNSAFGNPIKLSSNSTTNLHNIIGVTTISRNVGAYSIKALNVITAKIARCNFLNETTIGSTAGIDSVIALQPITTDTNGNIS